MTRHRGLLIALTVFIVICITACGAAARSEQAEFRPAGESSNTALDAAEPAAEAPAGAEAPGDPIVGSESDTGGTQLRQVAPDAVLPRLIIKRGDMAMTVENTDQTVAQVTGLATSNGGYIISQQIWEQDGFRFAALEFAVPVEDFERTLDILRTFGNVTSETATGEDVTEEFVDLESRLGNLRATQERLRELLADAENVEEALAVNRELSLIEEELEVVQGRMEYLANRAAFSTIGLTISPVIPTATPTVSPTPQPTFTPTPWRPGETAQDAVETLGATTRTVTEGLIYFAIVCGPWLLLLVIVAFPVIYLIRRRRRSRPAEPAGEPAEESAEEPAEQPGVEAMETRTAAASMPTAAEDPALPDDELNKEVD